MHIINFNNIDKIKLGRGHDTDVRIHDISVSRQHAFIKKDEQGRFYIEDNNSKFGTLVQIQSPLHLHEQFEYHFQAGRSVFSVTMQQEQSLFSFIRGGGQQANKNDHEILLTRDFQQGGLDGKFGLAEAISKERGHNRNPRLNRKHEIFNNYLGQFCNSEAQVLVRDQQDRQVLLDLNPESNEGQDQIWEEKQGGARKQPEDAEASNEEESIGDENEPLP